MSCTDYQTIIRQWFEDVMDTHISKCDSCADFFRDLNQETLNTLNSRRLARTPQEALMAYGQDEAQMQALNAGQSAATPARAAQSAVEGLPAVTPAAPPAIPPKAFGATGRLNQGPEIDPTSPGLICNIGRFILDERELEMLKGMATSAPSSELGLRVLTIKAIEDLKTILSDIMHADGVVGWAIIGSDGLMVAGFLPEDLNAENLAVRALSIYMGSEDMLERIGNERLQQIILYTDMGALFVANFGEGIFITISSATEPEKIIRTLKKIRDVS